MTQTLTDALQEYFAARPSLWIDGRHLSTVAGVYGWRSRCSDLRKRGLTIENRVRRLPGSKVKVSEYRFVPAAA